MEGIGNQADNQVVLGDFSIKSFVVGDVERDRCSEFVVARQLLGRLEGSTGYSQPIKKREISCRILFSSNDPEIVVGVEVIGSKAAGKLSLTNGNRNVGLGQDIKRGLWLRQSAIEYRLIMRIG